MAAFATVDDLQAYWRSFTANERTRAEKLLDYASVIIRAHCKGSEIDKEAASFVACDMAKTAMQSAGDEGAVTQMTMSGGPYSRTMQYANPTGDLYWKSQYDQILGLSGTDARCIQARTAYDAF